MILIEIKYRARLITLMLCARMVRINICADVLRTIYGYIRHTRAQLSRDIYNCLACRVKAGNVYMLLKTSAGYSRKIMIKKVIDVNDTHIIVRTSEKGKHCGFGKECMMHQMKIIGKLSTLYIKSDVGFSAHNLYSMSVNDGHQIRDIEIELRILPQKPSRGPKLYL